MKKTAKIFFGLLDKKKQSEQLDMKIQTLMSKGKLPQSIKLNPSQIINKPK